MLVKYLPAGCVAGEGWGGSGGGVTSKGGVPIGGSNPG